MKNSAVIIPLMFLIVVIIGVNDLTSMFSQWDLIGSGSEVSIVQKSGRALLSLWPFMTGLVGIWVLYTMSQTKKGDLTLSIAIILTVFLISYTLYQWQRGKGGMGSQLEDDEAASARKWTGTAWEAAAQTCTAASAAACNSETEGRYIIGAAAGETVGTIGDGNDYRDTATYGTTYCGWTTEEGSSTCKLYGREDGGDECTVLLPTSSGEMSLFGEMGHKVYRAVFYFTIVVVAVCASVHVPDGYFTNITIALPVIAVVGVDMVLSWFYSEYINSNEGEYNFAARDVAVKDTLGADQGDDWTTGAGAQYKENTRATINPEMLLINFMRGDNGSSATGSDAAWFTDPAGAGTALGITVHQDDRTFINSHFVFTTAFYLVLMFLLIVYSMGFFGNSASIVPVYVALFIIFTFPFIMTQVFLQECSINTTIAGVTGTDMRNTPTKTAPTAQVGLNIDDPYANSGHITTGNLYPSPKVRLNKNINEIREERSKPGMCTLEKYGGIQTLAVTSLLIAVLTSIENKNHKVVAMIISLTLIFAIESMVSKTGRVRVSVAASPYQLKGCTGTADAVPATCSGISSSYVPGRKVATCEEDAVTPVVIERCTSLRHIPTSASATQETVADTTLCTLTPADGVTPGSCVPDGANNASGAIASCTYVAPVTAAGQTVLADATACGGVTGNDLNTATSCLAVRTVADANAPACRYEPASPGSPVACGRGRAVDSTSACEVGCTPVAEYVPTCDLNSGTDSTAACPSGCREVRGAGTQ